MNEFYYLFLSLGIGIAIDLVYGDPSNKYHPVAWLGKIITLFIPLLKDEKNSQNEEKLNGMIFATTLTIVGGLTIHYFILTSFHLLGEAVTIILSALILKITIAIRGMEKHSKAIMYALEERDLKQAQYNLSMIVRRDTKNIDERHIISGTIECIGESTVDGIISPLFYFSLFGPAGAFADRIINTLDSMIGYKDDPYRHIGWMSARLDTLSNFIPSRISAFLMVISAKIIGADWKNAIQVLRRDHNKTFSPNAGYPMAAMAGALRIKLEKIGYYSLGYGYESASIEKCRIAISIMKLTTVLFCTCLSIPILAILYVLGWWKLLFGF